MRKKQMIKARRRAIGNNQQTYRARARRYARALTKSRFPALRTTGKAFLQISDIKQRKYHRGLFEDYCRFIEMNCVINLAEQETLKLMPYQLMVIYAAIEHKKIGTVLCLVPRKNGKSTLLGALANTHLLLSKDPKPEIYSIAPTVELASQIYMTTMIMADAWKVTDKSRYGKIIQSGEHTIKNTKTRGMVRRRVGSNATALNAMQYSLALCDESAEMKDECIDAILSGQNIALDLQSVVMITTAYDKVNCRFLKMCDECLRDWDEGNETSIFPILYMPPYRDAEKIDADDAEVWKELNPAWGVGQDLASLKKQRKILSDTEFKRKHLNLFGLENTQRLLTVEQLNTCYSRNNAEYEDIFKNTGVSIGIDLGLTASMTGLAMCARVEDEYYVRVWNYTSRSALDEKLKSRHNIFMQEEVDKGNLIVDGESIQKYEELEQHLVRIEQDFNVLRYAGDKYSGGSRIHEFIKSELTEKYEDYSMQKNPQTALLINALMAAIRDGKLRIYRTGIIDWELYNAELITYPEKYDIQKSGREHESCDGIYAMLYGLGYFFEAPDVDNSRQLTAEELDKLYRF